MKEGEEKRIEVNTDFRDADRRWIGTACGIYSPYRIGSLGVGLCLSPLPESFL